MRIALLLLFCCCPFLSAESTARVIGQHPRVLIDASDLPRLHQRIAGPWRAEFERAIAYVDDVVMPLAYESHSWGWAYNLRTLAFAHLMTGDETYLGKINMIFQQVQADIPTEEFACALYMRTGAMAYDWAHASMTVEQRAVAADALLQLARHHQTLWKHNDYNNHYVLNWMSPLWVAIALDGDGHADQEVQHLLLKLERHLKERVIVAANDMAGDDGGQAEGYFYANWGYFPPLAWLLELWRTGTGEDLFPECPALQYAAIWDIYGMRPFDHTLQRSDDCHEGYRFREGNEGTFMQLCAARYQDPYAAWISGQLDAKHPTRIIYDILWQDNSIEAKHPSTLPLARHFDALGWVSMRSSWDTDAAFAMFDCGDLFAGHQHCDNNSFVIHRYDLLAVDTGHYENGKHRANYLARTIAHNSITVFDPDERFGGNSWGGGTPGSGANDGGQTYISHPESVVEQNSEARFDRGDIIAYQHQEAFTYVVGDATRSYAPDKVKEFTRFFVHLPPDIFVVCDRVEASSATFTKRWLLHSHVQPAVDNDRITIRNGAGRLQAHCLWPRETTMRVVGGEGQAYLVDGVDYPPKKGYPERPPWRVEVSPRAEAARQYFLHVIHVPATGQPFIQRAQCTQNDDTLHCTFTHQGRSYRLTFNQSGPPVCHIRISEGERIIVNHRCLDTVQPEQSSTLTPGP